MKKRLTFAERFIPGQANIRKHFKGSVGEYYKSLYGLMQGYFPKKDFKAEVTNKYALPDMASEPSQLEFLKFLIRCSGAKNVLEIGTFVGYSTMHFASALPEDGKVVTIERGEEFSKIAERNFKRNNLERKIDLIVGDAFEVIPTLKDKRFDFIFLDGNKERYADYFEMLFPLMSREKGIMAIDDVLFQGDVLNREISTDKGRGIKKFLEMVRKGEAYEKCFVPIGNGMLLVYQKR